jgi:hypothetical protein
MTVKHGMKHCDQQNSFFSLPRHCGGTVWPCLLPEKQLIVHIECKYLSHHPHHQQPHFIGTNIPISSIFPLFLHQHAVCCQFFVDTPFDGLGMDQVAPFATLFCHALQ